MPVSPGSADFSAALDQVIKAAAEVRAGSGQAAEPQTGEAADGLVRATTGAPGRLAELTLHADALMFPPERLAREIVAAVNQALAAQEQAGGLAAAGVDLSGLEERLREVRETATARMATFMEAMGSAQENLAQRARR